MAVTGGQQVHPAARVVHHRILEGDGAGEHRQDVRLRLGPELSGHGGAAEVEVHEQCLVAELDGEHGEARGERRLALAGQGRGDEDQGGRRPPDAGEADLGVERMHRLGVG